MQAALTSKGAFAQMRQKADSEFADELNRLQPKYSYAVKIRVAVIYN